MQVLLQVQMLRADTAVQLVVAEERKALAVLEVAELQVVARKMELAARWVSAATVQQHLRVELVVAVVTTAVVVAVLVVIQIQVAVAPVM
jgi:hypothetical protein